MRKNLNEEWLYNEWPEVDIDGNVIERKKLTEACDKKAIKEEIPADELEVCPTCGKVKFPGEEPCDTCKAAAQYDAVDEGCCKEELCEAADEEEEVSEEEVEEEAVENLKDCLVAALEEIEVPEDEELVPKVVLDAIVGCLNDEDKEYLCSILCPEEEEEVAEEPTEEEIAAELEEPAE